MPSWIRRHIILNVLNQQRYVSFSICCDKNIWQNVDLKNNILFKFESDKEMIKMFVVSINL